MEVEREGVGERDSCRTLSGSSGSGDALDAADCPGSSRWFTAARRRDKPSTAARKSAPRSRTHSDNCKAFLLCQLSRYKKKGKTSKGTPSKTYRSLSASLPAERCLCLDLISTRDRRASRDLSGSSAHLFR